MVVGEDMAAGADDDARAQAGFQALARLVEAIAEEALEQGIVEQRMGLAGDPLAGIDIDDRGRGLGDRIGIGDGPFLAAQGQGGDRFANSSGLKISRTVAATMPTVTACMTKVTSFLAFIGRESVPGRLSWQFYTIHNN
jgi:hypothetical protein